MDVGERQLGFALAFDYDLDNFAAALGFARQTVEKYLIEPGKSAGGPKITVVNSPVLLRLSSHWGGVKLRGGGHSARSAYP